MSQNGLELPDLEELATDIKSELKGKFLTFWTDGQLFGVPIADVVQIIGLQPITPIPEAPMYQTGIINVRGSIIPVIDVRLRFGKALIEYTERACIILSTIQDTQVGFIVDEVNEVVDIEESCISPPPHLSEGGAASSYLTGIGKKEDKVILLLDTARILSEDMMNSILDQIC